MSDWSASIRQKAHEQGITLRELAVRLHMSETGLHLALKRKTLSADKLLAACRVLHMPLHELSGNTTGYTAPQASDNELLYLTARVERLEAEMILVISEIKKLKDLTIFKST